MTHEQYLKQMTYQLNNVETLNGQDKELETASKFASYYGVKTPYDIWKVLAYIGYEYDESKYYLSMEPNHLDVPQSVDLTFTMQTGDCEDQARAVAAVCSAIGKQGLMIIIPTNGVLHAVGGCIDSGEYFIVDGTTVFHSKSLPDLIVKVINQYHKYDHTKDNPYIIVFHYDPTRPIKERLVRDDSFVMKPTGAEVDWVSIEP